LTKTSSRETALLCVRYALDKKAYDLLLLDVAGLSSLAEYFLICTGRSDTQVQAIAQSIQENLARAGRRPLAVEGYSAGHWVLIDYGDVVVHVFQESVREFYDLERLWARAPQVSLPEPYRSQARDLRLASAAR
jgi:ribosome-associated protein